MVATQARPVARPACFHCGQVAACILLGATVICAIAALEFPWLAVSIDRGIISGSGEFTLWNVSISAQLGDVHLPEKVVRNDENLCTGEAGVYGIKIGQHVCDAFSAIRWYALLTFVAALFAFGASVAFTISSCTCARRVPIIPVRFFLLAASACTAVFATSALVRLYLLSRHKMYNQHLEKHLGKAVFCEFLVSLLTCVVACVQLAILCSLRYDAGASQGAVENDVELKEGQMNPADGDDAC